MFDETFNLAVALLLIAMGAYMLVLTRLFPLRVKTVCRGLLRLFRPGKGGKQDEISPFEALSAALGGSVGTGNIAGVASAIAIGGAGAIFWMWISGVIGMATKYAEVLIAMRYRVVRTERLWAARCIASSLAWGKEPHRLRCCLRRSRCLHPSAAATWCR